MKKRSGEMIKIIRPKYTILLLFILFSNTLFGQVDVYNYSGTRNLFDGKYIEAMQDFNNSIKIDSNNVFALSHRGYVKYFLKDYYGAVSDCDKAIKTDSTYAIAYNFRGIAKECLKDFWGAYFDYSKSIQFDSQDAKSYYNRGIIIAQIPELSNNSEYLLSAIKDFDKAIQLYSKYTDAYLARGCFKITIGLKQDGCLDLSKAGELGEMKAYDLIKQFCQ